MPKDWLSYIWGMNVERMVDVSYEDFVSEKMESLNLDDRLETVSINQK